MAEPKQEIIDGFIRQRRNLLLVSIVIFLLYHWDAEFEQLSILGNIIRLGNGENVFYFLWALMLYWLWRYKHYLFELGEIWLMDTLMRKKHSKLAEILDKRSKTSSFCDELRKYNPALNIDCENVPLNLRLVYNHKKFFNRNVVFTVQEIVDPVTGRGDNVHLNYVVRKFDLMSATSSSLWHLVNNSRIFSEYFLPPLLSLAVLIYCIFFHWIPDIKNLF